MLENEQAKILQDFQIQIDGHLKQGTSDISNKSAWMLQLMLQFLQELQLTQHVAVPYQAVPPHATLQISWLCLF